MAQSRGRQKKYTEKYTTRRMRSISIKGLAAKEVNNTFLGVAFELDFDDKMNFGRAEFGGWERC